MTFSDLNESMVADYLRLDDDSDELLEGVLQAAKSYVESYTGLSAEELDQLPDIPLAVLVLAQDMYDNRAYQAGNTQIGNVNKVVASILEMHRVNLV